MGLSQDKLQFKPLEVFYNNLISRANLSCCSWQPSTVAEDATSEHLKNHLVPTDCQGQRHLPLDQGAQFTETAQVHVCHRAWHLSHSPAQMPLMSPTNSICSLCASRSLTTTLPFANSSTQARTPAAHYSVIHESLTGELLIRAALPSLVCPAVESQPCRSLSPLCPCPDPQTRHSPRERWDTSAQQELSSWKKAVSWLWTKKKKASEYLCSWCRFQCSVVLRKLWKRGKH